MGLVLPITGGIRGTRPVFRATDPRPPVESSGCAALLTRKQLIQSKVYGRGWRGFLGPSDPPLVGPPAQLDGRPMLAPPY